MPEYGRNVQQLVNHAKTIEDEAYRQAFAERIIELMHQMNPQNRSIDDYREKLWKHLFQISKFDIDVVPSEGGIPTPESAYIKPEKVPYPKPDTRFRHYGTNVKSMIRKARDMEDEEKKQAFAGIIASYMKMAYRTWNRDQFISDEVIKGDLDTLSEGELFVRDSIYVDPVNHPKSNEKDRRKNNNNNKRNNNNNNSKKYNRNNNNNKNYRRK